LSKLKLSKADQILFVADGARWIWKRVNQWKRIGLPLDDPFSESILIDQLDRVAKHKGQFVETHSSI